MEKEAKDEKIIVVGFSDKFNFKIDIDENYKHQGYVIDADKPMLHALIKSALLSAGVTLTYIKWQEEVAKKDLSVLVRVKAGKQPKIELTFEFELFRTLGKTSITKASHWADKSISIFQIDATGQSNHPKGHRQIWVGIYPDKESPYVLFRCMTINSADRLVHCFQQYARTSCSEAACLLASNVSLDFCLSEMQDATMIYEKYE